MNTTFKFLLALSFLTFTCLPGSARATVFNVTPLTGGGCSNATPDDCNLQEALNVADSNGDDDTINVAAGTYSASTYTYTAAVGENNTLEIVGADRDTVILDGNDDNQVLDITTVPATPDDAAHVTIRNITISAGENLGSNAGGLEADTDEADITLENCIVTGNVADENAGADMASSSGDITLTDNIFFGNAAVGINDDSGGADITTGGSGAITLTGNMFLNNFAQDDNGGVDADTDSGPLTVTNNIISGNSASDDEAGVNFFSSSGTVTLTGNTITNNRAGDGDAGGDVATTTGNIILDSNTISHNVAQSGDTGGLSITNTNGDTTLVNNIFDSNSAPSGNEGGADISVNTMGDIVLTNNTVANNSADGNGGGLFISLNDETMSSAMIFNNIIFGNTANGDGADLFIEDDGNGSLTGAPVTFSHNDTSSALFSECENTGGCTPDIMQAGLGNIMGDPLFADAGVGDFNLLVGSPAINTGTVLAPDLPATDHDGKPRVIGDEVDMGALETGDSTVNVSPTSLNFGDVAVGQTAGQVLTIGNDGIQDISFTSMDLSDGTNYSINVDGGANPCGSTTPVLGAGTNCTIEVVFGPGSEGLKFATLTINSDSADFPSIVIQLFGAGTGDGGGGCGCRLDTPGSANSYRVVGLMMLLLIGGMLVLRRRQLR